MVEDYNPPATLPSLSGAQRTPKKYLNSNVSKNQGSSSKKKVLIIIDSNSVIHRAYHALPPLTTKKGELVNAVYGFLLVFFKVIKEFRPECIVACFDSPGPTLRHKKFKEYKAKRPPTAEELKQQIPKVKEILKVFNVPIFGKEGFEADDLIGTISKRALGIEKIIVSGDLDNLQLIDSSTKAYILRKGVKDTILYDENLVKERFQGLSPKQIVDFKALRGDPSDNIPGIAGIGEKTAINLLREFGTVENLYNELEKKPEKIKSFTPKLKKIILKQKERAFLSKDLAGIKKDAPINFNLEDCRWEGYDKMKAVKTLEDFDFYSLIGKIPGSEGEDLLRNNLKLW